MKLLRVTLLVQLLLALPNSVLAYHSIYVWPQIFATTAAGGNRLPPTVAYLPIA